MKKRTQSQYSGKNLEGVELLRAIARATGDRDEGLNNGKTPLQLINEYMKFVNDENYNWFSGKNYDY